MANASAAKRALPVSLAMFVGAIIGFTYVSKANVGLHVSIPPILWAIISAVLFGLAWAVVTWSKSYVLPFIVAALFTFAAPIVGTITLNNADYGGLLPASVVFVAPVFLAIGALLGRLLNKLNGIDPDAPTGDGDLRIYK